MTRGMLGNRRSVAGTVPLVALFASAITAVSPPADAAPPVQDRFSVFVEQQYMGSCGDFAVLTDYWFDVDYKAFYDNAGTLIRELVVGRVDGFSRYYNASDPTHVVEGGPNEVQISRYESPGSIGTVMGPAFRVNLPGQGVIFLMAGRLVIDLNTGDVLFEAGPQDWLEGNLDKLCAALR
jgi:hypothetical protein